jgi:hypothetical protein
MIEETSHLPAELQVRKVAESYFSAIDRRHWVDLARCFADDAIATYQTGTKDEQRISSCGAIVDQLQAILSGLGFSNHSISNMHIEFNHSEASVTTFAVVQFLAKGRVFARGLRYEDLVAKDNERWSIKERRHYPLWQYDVAATTPSLENSR